MGMLSPYMYSMSDNVGNRLSPHDRRGLRGTDNPTPRVRFPRDVMSGMESTTRAIAVEQVAAKLPSGSFSSFFRLVPAAENQARAHLEL